MKTMNNKTANLKMKTNVIAVAILGLSMLAINVNASSLRNANYSITPMESTTANVSETKAWTLTYNQKENIDVTIQMVPTANGNEYVVSSSNFEVKYANGKEGFGVKTAKQDRTNAVLDPEKIADQEILAPGKVTETEALGLIAYYLPSLVKE